jgi:hypothetical protein
MQANHQKPIREARPQPRPDFKVEADRRKIEDMAEVYRRIDEARQEPTTGHDMGPYRVNGMTIQERIIIGVMEVVEVKVGRGQTRQKAVRSKYNHPLDKYLVHGWLGDAHPSGDGDQRHQAGMTIHKHFMYALAMPKVVRNYSHSSGGGGMEEWSARRLDAREHFNSAMADLNFMGQRIVLSLCCLAEGLSDFDQEMMEEGAGWRPRFAMPRLIEALDDLRSHYRRNPEPRTLLS